MSLTTDIAHLTSEVTDLTSRVATWIDDADDRITAAIRAVPKMGKRIYVHATDGDDTATGTQDDPVRTIAEAVSRVPISGRCGIWLLSDVHIDSCVDASRLAHLGLVSSTGSAPARITFGGGWEEHWDGYRLCGLRAPRSVYLGGVEIVYPEIQQQPPSDRPVVDTGLLNMHDGGYLSIWNVTISGTQPSSPLERHVIRHYGGPLDMRITGGTSWPAALAGVILEGCAAGQNPNDLWNIRTNITSM